MMNNTNPTLKVTVSKTAPWTVYANGAVYRTYPNRTAAREAAADYRTNGLPDTAHDTPASKAQRKAAGLSRSQMAAKLGVSVYALDRLEAKVPA